MNARSPHRPRATATESPLLKAVAAGPSPDHPIIALPADNSDPIASRELLECLALNRLGAFLDDEGDSLDRVLQLLDLRGAQSDLKALRALHVEPGHEREALRDAAEQLVRLADDLAETPDRPLLPWMLALANERTADFDARIRWLGARTEDLLSVVRRALA